MYMLSLGNFMRYNELMDCIPLDLNMVNSSELRLGIDSTQNVPKHTLDCTEFVSTMHKH